MVDKAKLHAGIGDAVAAAKAEGHALHEIIEALLIHAETLQDEKAQQPPPAPESQPVAASSSAAPAEHS